MFGIGAVVYAPTRLLQGRIKDVASLARVRYVVLYSVEQKKKKNPKKGKNKIRGFFKPSYYSKPDPVR